MPEVLMPRLSDTMQEGILSRWLKREGDPIHKGDVLAEIETDKATMELEAYDEGPLTALLVTEGTTVPIGAPIALIGEDSSKVSPAAAPVSPPSSTPAAPRTAPGPDPTSAAPRGGPNDPAPTPASAYMADPAELRRRASPLARKIAAEHGLDLATIPGTGPDGRIVRADIESAITAPPSERDQIKPEGLPASRTPTPHPQAAAAPAAPTPESDDEEVPLTAIRRVTARRLTENAATPHFYLTSVIDADRLLAFRAEVNGASAGTDGKVSVTDLLVRACAVTLRAHPQVNSSWAGDTILRHHRVHIGVAAATTEGLIVPVIRDVDRKGVREIATETRALTERARSGTLTPPEFTGGTFTISNLGMYGIDHFTAIINPPEAAILAVGAATPTPVARDGQVVVQATLKLTLSIDHRVLDGAPAAAFLRDLKDTLQEPLRIVT